MDAKCKDSDLQWEQVHDCEENKGKGEKESSDPILYHTTVKKRFILKLFSEIESFLEGR